MVAVNFLLNATYIFARSRFLVLSLVISDFSLGSIGSSKFIHMAGKTQTLLHAPGHVAKHAAFGHVAIENTPHSAMTALRHFQRDSQ